MWSRLQKRFLRTLEATARQFDLEVRPAWSDRLSSDLSPELHEIAVSVRTYTMTSYARIVSLIMGIEYLLDQEMAGAITECGVWRGGSMMAVARTLLQRGVTNRDLFLYDTFEGMPAPSPHDGQALSQFRRLQAANLADRWCRAELDEVWRNMRSTGYPGERIHCIKGKVEETIPDHAPTMISLLRLDTDWYESTRHTMEHLYPRLTVGGLLILDDYGHWDGCKRAVDEFFATRSISLFLSRVDYTGRIAVKPSEHERTTTAA